MNKKLHNKKHLYRKILICIIQIILSQNLFGQNIETKKEENSIKFFFNRFINTFARPKTLLTIINAST